MALSNNPYIYLPLTSVQLLQTQYLQVIQDIAGAGQSYAVPGRTFTRADLRAVEDSLAKMGQALAYLTGKGLTAITPIINQTAANFPGGQQDYY